MLRTIRIAALSVAMLAAALLGTAGGADPGSFLRTAPYELIVGKGGGEWCVEGDAASTLAEPADLRGPHFSFSLACLFKAPAIPDSLAASLPALARVPPAEDGVEFLFTQVALPAEYDSEHKKDPAALTSWIQVGERRVDLLTAPGIENHYVLSVPVDEPAVLWVEDSGRAQGVDLRSGAQVEPVTAYYNGLALRWFELDGYDTGEVDFRNSRRAGWIRCRTGYAEANRAVWTEERGWAESGTVFLEVSTNWCSETELFTWELDMSQAFTVDGEAPVSWTATDTDDEYWDRLTMVFAIPEDAAEATVHFSPVGTVGHKASGDELTGTRLPNFAWKMDF
ncbi:hypothetical protein AB0K52_08395 [Glycomyces sp. NPDC049804]|uniref:hypothetical protein n=1 Tax=Glycomyces sp. NPDC049804 TaxID=3154363 RepID=UPI003417A961